MSWDKAIAFTLRWEGGFVCDPLDAGGATNRGITQATLDAAFRSGIVSHNNVKKLSKDEAIVIYKARYWEPYNWGQYGEPVDMVMFDMAVNHGMGGTAKIAQRACVSLGVPVKVDGKWGPETRDALYSLSQDNVRVLAKMLLIKRLNFYGNIVASKPSQTKFLKGWCRRTSALAVAAGVKV